MNMAPTMEFPAGWCMVKALDRFFGDRMLSDVTGDTRRAYASQRTTDVAARRELEDLRAAINHHRREGLCNKVVEVVLPPERPCRKRWLTRSEAARLIWSAWRYREIQKGKPTDRRSRQRRAPSSRGFTGTRATSAARLCDPLWGTAGSTFNGECSTAAPQGVREKRNPAARSSTG
jgi:hypothetical protein